jgi:hypothetical protein
VGTDQWGLTREEEEEQEEEEEIVSVSIMTTNDLNMRTEPTARISNKSCRDSGTAYFKLNGLSP